jgi:hypothetical protein
MLASTQPPNVAAQEGVGSARWFGNRAGAHGRARVSAARVVALENAKLHACERGSRTEEAFVPKWLNGRPRSTMSTYVTAFRAVVPAALARGTGQRQAPDRRLP